MTYSDLIFQIERDRKIPSELAEIVFEEFFSILNDIKNGDKEELVINGVGVFKKRVKKKKNGFAIHTIAFYPYSKMKHKEYLGD